MTLDNLMNMATADRYTEDGRQQIEDARRTYKPGEISEKTGFQKQNDGTWAPPKAGAAVGSHRGSYASSPIHTQGGEAHAPGSLYKEDPAKLAAEARKAGNIKKAEFYEAEAKREAAERGTQNSKSRYEGIKRLSDLPPEDRLAFRKRHDATTGEGNQYRVVKAGKVMSVKAQSPEEARDVLRIVGNGTIALKDIKEIGKKQPATEPSSRPSPRPKSPAVKKPDVLNMTRSGAKKRIEAAGGKFIGNEGGKVWFETSDGGLYYFVMNKDNGRVASSSSISAPHNEADKAEIDKIKQKIAGAQEEQEAWAAMNGHKSYEDMLKAEDEAGEFYDRWRRGEIDEHGNELNKSTAAKEPDLSKVGHYNLNVARNDMNTTRAEDKWLDNFVTEMHEDGTSLDEIIKRQDEVFAKSKGRYPEEEKTYKSLREKIMKHYGGTSDSACDEQLYTPESINGPRENLERQLTGDTRIRVRK